MRFKYFRAISLTLVTAGFVACGGGGGGGSGGQALAGIDRLGASTGIVTGFGSIFVNGIEFETNDAMFTIDDQPGIESDLEVGQVVTVIGTFDANGTSGTADSVSFDDAVEGPISSIDIPNDQLVVAGQTVLVDAATSFDDNISPASLDGLSVNDFVEVSGFIDADDNIRATRIEAKPAGSEVEVHGFAAGVTATTFMLNALTVDYSAAMLDDFPGGAITSGDFVEAKGDGFGPGGELIATEVELETQGPDPDEIDEFEIEGFITGFVAGRPLDNLDFDVSGVPVITDSSTVFEGDTALLGLNTKVEVEGTVNPAGVVVADEVDIRTGIDRSRLAAQVDSVNPLVALGITVRVDALTRIEDKSAANLEPFSVADINVGDYIEVRGDENPPGSGEMLATLLERDDLPGAPGEGTELRGFVESVDVASFTILGVTINTDVGACGAGGTCFAGGITGVSDLMVGDQVSVDGMETSSTAILADEVELEN